METNINKRQRFIKKMFILMGLPRSGKTTLRNMILNEFYHIVPVSADDLRYEIYGQRYWQNGEDDVWAFRKHHLNSLMKNGTTILIDETNTTKKRREPLLKLCDEYGYTPVYLHVYTLSCECIRRAKNENDTYIIPTIERQSEQFELPESVEIESFEFSSIHTIVSNNYKTLDFNIFRPEFKID